MASVEDQQDQQNQALPWYQKLFAVLLVLIYGTSLYLFHSRLHADFWPLDSSRVGPNLVASYVLAVPAAFLSVLLYPPMRRRLHRFVDRKLQPIHDHFAKVHEHNQWMATQQARDMRSRGIEPDPHPHFDLATNAPKDSVNP